MENIPFRWDFTHREQLGSLLTGDKAESYPRFIEDVRICCAKILDRSGNADLVFVGRSPESLYDYLSGITSSIAFNKRLIMLNFSMRFNSVKSVRNKKIKSLFAMREQFRELKLDPENLIKRQHPVCFVDVVADGYTFGNLSEFILSWAGESVDDYPAVVRKIKFVGLLWESKGYMNVWRYWQHLEWVNNYPKKSIKNVSVPGRFWDYIGNKQKKMEDSNRLEYWGTERLMRPSRKKERLQALRSAHEIYKIAQSREERRLFVNELYKQKEISFKWMRELSYQIKNFPRNRNN